MISARCRVCGKEITIESWSHEYEKLKVADDPAYVCDPCQEKIRVEVQNDQPH